MKAAIKAQQEHQIDNASVAHIIHVPPNLSLSVWLLIPCLSFLLGALSRREILL